MTLRTELAVLTAAPTVVAGGIAITRTGRPAPMWDAPARSVDLVEGPVRAAGAAAA
jgi:hypothetical protein